MIENQISEKAKDRKQFKSDKVMHFDGPNNTKVGKLHFSQVLYEEIKKGQGYCRHFVWLFLKFFMGHQIVIQQQSLKITLIVVAFINYYYVNTVHIKSYWCNGKFGKTLEKQNRLIALKAIIIGFECDC